MAEPFGSFELERLLGRGGMAEAYIAHRRVEPDGAPLVLKRIRPDHANSEEYLKRFVLEAQVASRLSHENLARFREFGRVGSCHYLVMDMVRGYSLHRLLEPVFRDGAPPPLPAALTIGAGVLDGLAAMHDVKDEQGHRRPMLHRDVTPSNVIVSDRGQPVIIDFGITKDIMGPAITLPGKVIGTARYMSPEHRKAEFIDARADVFSASVILFELLFGRHPWPPLSTMKELLRVTFDPPDISPEMEARVPREIIDVVLGGLADDPKDRYRDASEMRRALGSCAACPALLDDGHREVTAWVDSLRLPLDEELSRPVLDLAGNEGVAEVMWTASGLLSSEARAEDPTELPESLRSETLTIPPLPPRREAALADDPQLAEHMEAAFGGFPWAKLAVVLVAVALVAGLAWFVAQG